MQAITVLLSAISRPFDILGKNSQSFALLVLRLYVASIFLKSGVQKIGHWESTLFLFEYEYSVPLLSPAIAAVLGTAAEIILPILLILGLMARASAFALFFFNIVAVASYGALLKGEMAVNTILGFVPIGLSFPTKGFEDHFTWGLIILAIFAFGAGRFGIDRLLFKERPLLR